MPRLLFHPQYHCLLYKNTQIDTPYYLHQNMDMSHLRDYQLKKHRHHYHQEIWIRHQHESAFCLACRVSPDPIQQESLPILPFYQMGFVPSTLPSVVHDQYKPDNDAQANMV